MAKIKLYLVKREVKARSIKQAMVARGTIYEISETRDIVEDSKKKQVGFSHKKR